MSEVKDFLVDQRDQAIVWARSVLGQPNVVFLDTETTGLDRSAEVVQVGIVDLQGGVLLDTLVKPVYDIPAAATRVHGITNADVAGADRYDRIYPELAEIVNGKIVVIYNAAYDVRLLYQSADICMGEGFGMPDLRPPAERWDCAMVEYARYVGEWNEYRGDFRWQRLEGGDHSAVGDCQAALALVRQMAAARLSTETVEG